MRNPHPPHTHPDEAQRHARRGSDGSPVRTALAMVARSRYLLASGLLAGIVFGFCSDRQRPQLSRASIQLMFRAETPLSLDTTTGAVRGGLPGDAWGASLVQSDAILARVRRDPQLRSLTSPRGLSDREIDAMVREDLRFQPLTDSEGHRERMVARLHLDGPDRELVAGVVEAVGRAIVGHCEQQREAPIKAFGRLVHDAQAKLLPQQAALEREYQDFRDAAPLHWGPAGRAINPHRQRQWELETRRDQLQREQRRLDGELRFVRTMRSVPADPAWLKQVLPELSRTFGGLAVEPRDAPQRRGEDSPDLQRQCMQVERELLPLQARLVKLESTRGVSHPEAEAVRHRIEQCLDQLRRLNGRIARERRELAGRAIAGERSEPVAARQAERASALMQALAAGLKERRRANEQELRRLNRQIALEKHAADELETFEARDAAYRRRIAGLQGMLSQVEQQLAGLDPASLGGAIAVAPLQTRARTIPTGSELSADLMRYGVLGLALGCGLMLLVESTAQTFRSSDELQQTLGLAVLARISLDRAARRRTGKLWAAEGSRSDHKLASADRPDASVSRASREIRTAMFRAQRQHGHRVFQFTSPRAHEGKSAVAANVSCAVAQAGKRTLLIDLDGRGAGLSAHFGRATADGVTNTMDMIGGEWSTGQVVRPTPIENLDRLSGGSLPGAAAEAATLAELGELMRWARQHYDVVIVDAPPVLAASDSAAIATHVDAALLVMRIQRRCKPNAQDAVATMRWSGATLLGVVVNEGVSWRESREPSRAGVKHPAGAGVIASSGPRRLAQPIGRRGNDSVTPSQQTIRVDRTPVASVGPQRPHLQSAPH